MLLTVEQAALRLQLSPLTVRRQLARGALRGIKRGRVWRIEESALLEASQPPVKPAILELQENPLARALAMLEDYEAKYPKVVANGLTDSAAEIRQMRGERTP